MPNQTEDLIWEDPPAGGHTHRKGTLSFAALKLRSRKGKWARVRRYNSSATSASMAFQIRAGRSSHFQPEGAFEAVARTVDDEHWVFARYVGEDKESERSSQTAPDGA